MNRPCYALTFLLAALTSGLFAVGSASGQCWMDGRIGPPNRGLCPIEFAEFSEHPMCYVVDPPVRLPLFPSEHDPVHDRAVYGAVAVVQSAMADEVEVDAQPTAAEPVEEIAVAEENIVDENIEQLVSPQSADSDWEYYEFYGGDWYEDDVAEQATPETVVEAETPSADEVSGDDVAAAKAAVDVETATVEADDYNDSDYYEFYDDYYGEAWDTSPAVDEAAAVAEVAAEPLPVGEDPMVEDHENWAAAAGVQPLPPETGASEVAHEDMAADSQVEDSAAARDYPGDNTDEWTEEDWYAYYSYYPELHGDAAAPPVTRIDLAATAACLKRDVRNVIISPYQLAMLDCHLADLRYTWPRRVQEHPVSQAILRQYREAERRSLARMESVQSGVLSRSVLRSMATGFDHASRSLSAVSQMLNSLAGDEVAAGDSDVNRR